jgi:hypothetical protein
MALKKKLKYIIGAAALISAQSSAINLDGTGDTDGLVALYLFKNYNATTGIVQDVSGVSPAADLQVHDPIGVQYDTDSFGNLGLDINIQGATTGFKSLEPASGAPSIMKIINACSQTDEITIEVYVRNLLEEPVLRSQPLKVVSMARVGPDPDSTMMPAPDVHLSQFHLGQAYDDGGFYQASLRDGSGMLRSFESPHEKGRVLFNNTASLTPPQHIVYVKDAMGTSQLWMSDSRGVLNLANQRINAPSIKPWAQDANRAALRLGVANEPMFYSFTPPYTTINGQNVLNPEWKAWMGTLYTLAIYCKAKTSTQLIGAGAPDSTPQPTYPPWDLSRTLTATYSKALAMYARLTSVRTPPTNPVISQMVSELDAGRPLAAALLATHEHAFYNMTVKDMAARMSNREQTANVPLNDMIASIIGVARDDTSARELLTGNFTYWAKNPLKAAVPANMALDMLTSNRHFQALDDGHFDLAAVLERDNLQYLYNGANPVAPPVPHPDAAGVLTSRAFMAAHAIAGTNRRLVEYTMQQFACIPMSQWADVNGTDTFVGRDVDRAPGGDYRKYAGTCRACHSVMDAFRGAFAKVDFSANYVKHADVMFGLTAARAADNEKPEFMFQDPPGIAGKMNRNADTFDGGNEITSDYWQNNANRGFDADYFGWPTVPSGQTTHIGFGIRSFGKLVSESKAFNTCMARRAYRAVCKREVDDTNQIEVDMVKRVGQEFADNGFKLRELFARIAIAPECLGQ